MSTGVKCHNCSEIATEPCPSCLDKSIAVFYCNTCLTNHLRIMHPVSFSVTIGSQPLPFTFISSTDQPKSNATLILKTPKKKGKVRSKVDEEILKEWIRKNLK